NTTIEKIFWLLTDAMGRRRSEERPPTPLTSSRPFFTLALIALLLSGMALLLGPVPHARAAAQDREDGHVYVLNNDLSSSNSITVFTRKEDGSLKLLGTTSIGGLGSLSAFADGTQGSLILTHGERTRLFAVDAGSDQISVVH